MLCRSGAMPYREFSDIEFGDLFEREAEFIGAGGDVPKDIAELVPQLVPGLRGYLSRVIPLDLLDNVRHLAGLAGETQRRILDI